MVPHPAFNGLIRPIPIRPIPPVSWNLSGREADGTWQPNSAMSHEDHGTSMVYHLYLEENHRKTIGKYITIHLLVGGIPTPLKNHGVRQLGWWHSQYDGKNEIHVPNHQIAYIYIRYKSSVIWCILMYNYLDPLQYVSLSNRVQLPRSLRKRQGAPVRSGPLDGTPRLGCWTAKSGSNIVRNSETYYLCSAFS